MNSKIIEIDPNDKYGNIRTLVFKESQSGVCEDVYRMKEHSGVLIRQRLDDTTVRWLTASKWSGGYEASCPVKDGLTLNIVDSAGLLIFTETTYRTEWNGGGQAEKRHSFSWEEA